MRSREGIESKKSKGQIVFRIFLIAIFLLLLLISLGVYRFLTHHQRAHAHYAKLAEGKESEWWQIVPEINLADLENGLYLAIDSKNNLIPAVAEESFTYNAIEDEQAHAMKSNGALFVVLHKWINYCSGICYFVEEQKHDFSDDFLTITDIKDSNWKFWSVDFEKQIGSNQSGDGQ